jgi:hypothetical protein
MPLAVSLHSQPHQHTKLTQKTTFLSFITQKHTKLTKVGFLCIFDPQWICFNFIVGLTQTMAEIGE